MKKEELRIGNYVTLTEKGYRDLIMDFEEQDLSALHTDLDSGLAHAHVISISYEVELFGYDCDLDYYSYEEIKPIPLTKEWLLKLGFHFDEDAMMGDTRGWQLDFNNLGVEFSFIGSELFDSEEYHHRGMKYVHEVQNYYYAITGNELA